MQFRKNLQASINLPFRKADCWSAELLYHIAFVHEMKTRSLEI